MWGPMAPWGMGVGPMPGPGPKPYALYVHMFYEFVTWSFQKINVSFFYLDTYYANFHYPRRSSVKPCQRKLFNMNLL